MPRCETLGGPRSASATARSLNNRPPRQLNIRNERFVHPRAKLRPALLELMDSTAVLAAAEIIGDADDEHDGADECEEVSEGKDNREILEDVCRHEIG